MRPRSIVNFERCYLAAIAIGLANSLVTLPLLLRTPQVAQATAMLGSGFLYVTLLVSVAIALLLWYFTARAASVVAKWIVVVFFAFAVLGVLGKLVSGFPSSLSAVLTITAFVLQAVSVYLLFRPDAVIWFRRDDAVSDLNETFR